MDAIATSPDRLRRLPQQGRSRARLQHILQAADRLLAREGLEALTTTRIAAEAGISVGSLYKYFADRHAILAALAAHYAEELAGLMERFADEAATAEWDDLPGAVIDAYVALYRARPGHRALWFGRAKSDEVIAADKEKKRVEVDALGRILVARGIVHDDDRLETICRTAILCGDALLAAAFRASPDGDAEQIEEAKRILRAYLAEVGRVTAGPQSEAGLRSRSVARGPAPRRGGRG